MKKIFLILLFISFSLSIDNIPNFPDFPDIPDYKKIEFNLDIKNENGGNEIELKKGIYTKILLQLTPNSIIKFSNSDYFIFLNQSSYKLTIDDEKIILLDNELILKPNKEFAYYAYLGINCDTKFDELEYSIPIKVTPLNDNTIDVPIKYSNIKVKINQEKNLIDLDILLNNMSKQSFNYFKISHELYNVEAIHIEMIENEDFIFKGLNISSFNQREEISEKNSENHGILFDFSFRLDNYNKINKKDFEIKIDIKRNFCFELVKKNFSVEVNSERPAKIDDNTKTTFKYNLEDITKTHNMTNTLKLRTFIPVYPVVIKCELNPNTSMNGNETEPGNSTFYRNIINKSGSFDIIINNLDNYKEYYAFCELSNTNCFNEKFNSINISIGDFINADIYHKLIPLRDENALPQCAHFTFKNQISFGLLMLYDDIYCKYIMKKDETLSLRSLPTIACEPIIDLSDINMFSGTICVAPLPSYNNGYILGENNKKDFENKFDEFVEKFRNFKNPLNNKLIIDVKDVDKYFDIDINPLSIKAEISKEDSSNFGVKKFVFNVLSTHKYPVQCFYNLNLDENSNIFNLEMPINLSPNKYQQITVLIASILAENKMYSLNFKCYNLPGFEYKYKTTGLMTMYTYLNTDGLDQLINKIISPLTINCNSKDNQQNPRCIVDQEIPLMENLQTDIPDFYKNIYSQIPQFEVLVDDVQNQILRPLINDLIENINNLDFKNIIEKSTKIMTLLEKMDCYMLYSGNNSKKSESEKNYSKCEKIKKNYFEKIMNIIKPYLDSSSLINNITSEIGLGENLEENFKYVSFLINSISKNFDSLSVESIQSLIDIFSDIKDNFEETWNKIETYLKDKKYLNTSIISVKKDILITNFQSILNLPKSIHFQEIEGKINGNKTNTGLFISEIGKQIQKEIIDFSKQFNEFGEGLYNISSSTFLKVITNKGVDIKFDAEVQIFEVPDKNIIIKVYPNYMFRTNKANNLQILVHDSPLTSVKSNGKEDKSSDIVNIFVNIILYDDKNEAISIKNIDNEYRIEILYLKSAYNSLEKCFYYNENNNDLETGGISITDSYEYNGQKYFKCTSNHLTAFTAGTYKFNSNISLWAVLLILGAIIIVLVGFVLLLIIVKKKKNKERFSDFNSNGDKKENILMDE